MCIKNTFSIIFIIPFDEYYNMLISEAIFAKLYIVLSRYLLRRFITVHQHTPKSTHFFSLIIMREICIIQNVNNYERNLYVFDTNNNSKNSKEEVE